MLRARSLAVLFPLLTLCAAAQTADPVARAYHPALPLPAYDVATIKPFVPVTAPNGMIMMGGSTIRQYIRNAFSPPSTQLASSQVIGGPDWVDKDKFDIKGKPSPDLEVAMKKMNNEDQTAQNRAMQQALLADRFHLKVHFEVREMPIYILTSAKGGLKIKPVDPPPARDPNAPPAPFTPPPPGGPLPPGMMMIMMKSNGERTMRARSTNMSGLLSLLRNNSGEAGDRPIIDHTGFTGHFDVDELSWAPLTTATSADSSAAPSTPSDAPSLATALEETLGIKLVATKGPVEVVVIDSIDHPSEN